MNFSIYLYSTLLILLGIFCGSLISYLLFRHTLNKRLKEFNSFLKSISTLHKVKNDFDKKKANALILLNEKFKELNKEIQKSKNPEYDEYLRDLNQILNQKGIKDIHDTDPDT